MKAKRRKKRMMKMRWSTWLQIIHKRTLGLTQLSMRRGLLKLLIVEPATISISFLFYFLLYCCCFLYLGLFCLANLLA